MMKKIIIAAAFLCASVFFAADFSTAKSQTAWESDQQVILSPEGIGSRRRLYAGAPAYWTSSDPCASVTADGTVVAVHPGTALIQAREQGTGKLLLSVQAVIREMNTFSPPETMLALEAEAFIGTRAERIILPESIQSIDPDAFLGCDSLLILYIPVHALPNQLHIGEQTVIFIRDDGVPFNGYVGNGHVAE